MAHTTQQRTLVAALREHKDALLRIAVDDLLYRTQGADSHPRNPACLPRLLESRDTVCLAARKVSAENFTAALMEVGFLT